MQRIPAGRAVTYELTDPGRSLLDILTAVYARTSEHSDERLDARDPDNYPSTRPCADPITTPRADALPPDAAPLAV